MTSFNNNSDQKERRQVLKNDAATLHQFAQSEANEISGRWAKPTTVNASQKAVHYPRLPTSSPWSSDPVGPEPPYGQDISEPPVVGESWKIEKSLDRDFGVARSIRDGVPSATGPVMPRSSEPTPDSEVARANSSSQFARQPLPLSGAGNKTDAMVRPAPTNSRANLRRRLV